MKTLTFNSTELKTIFDDYVTGSTSFRCVTTARIDHGHVDSDDFFRDLDLNTGRYPLKDLPKVDYRAVGGYPSYHTADLRSAILQHIDRLGYRLVGEMKFYFQVPEKDLAEIRRCRYGYVGQINGKVVSTVEVKRKNIVHLISDLF